MTNDISLIREKAEKECNDSSAMWIYGSEQQARLNELSITMSRLLMNSVVSGLDLHVEDMISRLNLNNIALNHKGIIKVNVSKRYKDLLKSIDDMSIELRINQAQLLKDISVYERMEHIAEQCYDELNVYIDVAEKRLLICKNNGDEDWYNKFEKKIEDLRLSNIITMQCKTQIKIMKSNNIKLTEKLESVLANTIPLWRNQVALEFDLERLEDESNTYKNIEHTTKSILKDNNRSIHKKIGILKKKVSDDNDIKKMQLLNDKLENTLKEITIIDKTLISEETRMGDILNKFGDNI